MRHNPAADITDKVSKNNQHGHHQHQRNKARHHQIAHRIGSHNTQRVNLLGNLHRAKLSRNRRTYTAGNNNACQHRHQLTRHSDSYNAAYGRGRTQTHELLGCLYGKNHTGTENRHHHNRQRIRSQQCHLTHNLLSVGILQTSQRSQQQQRQLAAGSTEGQYSVAHCFTDRFQHLYILIFSFFYIIIIPPNYGECMTQNSHTDTVI